MNYNAYIDSSYYLVAYKGKPVPSDFDRIALRASDELDNLTYNRVRRRGLSSYDSDTQERIKLAACTIAEAISLVEAATDSTGIVTVSESIGGAHSITIDKDSVSKIMADAIKRAKQYLFGTGLLSAGVMRC